MEQRKLLDELITEAQMLDGESYRQKIFAIYLDDWLKRWDALM